MSGIATRTRTAARRLAACAAAALLLLGVTAWSSPPTAPTNLPNQLLVTNELSVPGQAHFASQGPFASQVTLTGRVVDHDSGEPLAGAQLYVKDTGRGTLTGDDGRYSLILGLQLLARDELTVVVELIGYQAQQTVIESLDGFRGSTVELNFRLHAQALALGEVTVLGERTSRKATPPPPSPSTTPAEALRVVPSVPAPEGRLVDQARAGRAVHGAGARFRRRGHPRPRHLDPDWNREQYAHIDENDFRAVEAEPLSTFSIDVDRASYSNVRRFLREGRLPPVDAVQIEEMLNYFPYRYPLPDGDHPVAVATELGVAPWRPEHRILRIGLASRPIDTADLPLSNLVFLLDVSGSMQALNKLHLVKRSMRLLVDQLRPEDRVAIVVYAGAAGLVLESTPGSEKERILEAIGRLRAGGSTAGGAGLRLAYRVARENFLEGGNNRVILATDGDFNVGPSSDSEMVRLIEEKRDQGTFLTVLGFGTGNLQSGKMQSLAQHGNGNYAYIDTLAEARKVFVSEMGGTLLTVATDVKLQVEFNPARVGAYRLIGYENRLLANEDFNDDRKDAGDLGAGHRVTALYEIIPAGVDSEVELPTVDPLRYQREGDQVGAASRDEIAFVRLRYKRPDGDTSTLLEHPVRAGMDRPSADFHFATAVAGFGMLLRQSKHRGSLTVADVLRLARDGLSYDPQGYRNELVRMVERYRQLTPL